MKKQTQEKKKEKKNELKFFFNLHKNFSASNADLLKSFLTLDTQVVAAHLV